MPYAALEQASPRTIRIVEDLILRGHSRVEIIKELESEGLQRNDV